MHRTLNRKGQSTFEYILLITVVLAAAIVFLNDNGTLKKAIDKVFTNASNWTDSSATKLPTTAAVQPAP